jgi:uncharacterized protein
MSDGTCSASHKIGNKQLMDLNHFEKIFEAEITQRASLDDPAHDVLHFKRVVKTAKTLCKLEKARLEIVLPAAWMHDFVIVAKDHPLRKQASRLSAEKAVDFLKSVGYPEIYFHDIAHAIEAHSFSAAIETLSIEAAIVQDADRLDALGAIGIARCFSVGALMKRPFYEALDPFCAVRAFDDSKNTLDHFYVKLFTLAETMKTKSAQAEGKKRIQAMKNFIQQLQSEI